ncbi:MAG: tRNA preQ1(34) S-adenosylmethionine ribosyltransferase-isomerase QueA [Syntrophobacterales bacterium]|nr:tRNA preQ1(34) S-adenosylmethionine ribosyltransferase-isomerase QueA [Syntrophobacterales bacterium]
MRTEDFSYELPAAAIAQAPLPRRDRSRMLVLDRTTGSIEHRIFHEIAEYFREGDVLVVNDSQVIPARLLGRKESGGSVEILLLSRTAVPGKGDEETWEALLKPARRIRVGTEIHLPEKGRARVLARLSDKKWRLCLSAPEPLSTFLRRHGRAPLPPYIRRSGDTSDDAAADLERYQTVYARVPGSVAAPTAGFHFSREVLDTIRGKGVPIVAVTLHVGYGTFMPVTAAEVEDHRMEAEYFEISQETAATVNDAARVIAVGTTATRVLETAADAAGKVRPASGWTSLYIYPGYRFRRIQTLLTNFHLPKSSLYLLTCAFGGRELIAGAYREAVAAGYRFYSYGDCMLIL